jgi:MerR family transcriptional regulator, light-induced transcriptional regulator
MNNFSISQMAQLSGLKPHTIRIWEQRYNTMQPHRSEGNTRYYDDLQLRRLLNIRTLSLLGYKVSDLSAMKDEQLFRLISKQQAFNVSVENEYYVNSLVSAGMEFNEGSFEKILAHCMLKFSLKTVYKEIILPLLQRMGLLWSADVLPLANEHFISNLLRQKIFTAIDALPLTGKSKSTWLCFLPEDEFHEIGLLFANWLIRSHGHQVVYLGSNVPLSTLPEAVKKTGATNLLTFFVKNNSVDNYIEIAKALSDECPQKKIFIAANPSLLKGKLRSNVRLLHNIEDLEIEL